MKKETAKEKYAQFALSKNKEKDIEKYPTLDEDVSKSMIDNFLKGKK